MKKIINYFSIVLCAVMLCSGPVFTGCNKGPLDEGEKTEQGENNGSQDENDSEDSQTSNPVYSKFDGLKGNVEKVTLSYSSLDYPEFNQTHVMKYNEFGGLILHQYNTSNRETIQEFYYDDNENRIESVTYENGNVGNREIFGYDEEGKWISLTIYYNGEEEERERRIYEYNSLGLRTKLTSYKPDGTSSVLQVWNYDSKGFCTDDITYQEGSTPYEIKHIYTRNSAGWILGLNTYQDGALTQEIKYSLDQNNNRLEEEIIIDRKSVV